MGHRVGELLLFLMTVSKGGTITLGGKTYNISQINSVYIGTTSRYTGGQVWGLWFVGGILGIAVAQVPALWFILTIAALVLALIFSNKQDFAVFFDMSSGKVSAYSNKDREKVENIKNDIIKGLEEGYFPNYLQGRNHG
jgi:hypothetical protein